MGYQTTSTDITSHAFSSHSRRPAQCRICKSGAEQHATAEANVQGLWKAYRFPLLTDRMQGYSDRTLNVLRAIADMGGSPDAWDLGNRGWHKTAVNILIKDGIIVPANEGEAPGRYTLSETGIQVCAWYGYVIAERSVRATEDTTHHLSERDAAFMVAELSAPVANGDLDPRVARTVAEVQQTVTVGCVLIINGGDDIRSYTVSSIDADTYTVTRTDGGTVNLSAKMLGIWKYNGMMEVKPAPVAEEPIIPIVEVIDGVWQTVGHLADKATQEQTGQWMIPAASPTVFAESTGTGDTMENAAASIDFAGLADAAVSAIRADRQPDGCTAGFRHEPSYQFTISSHNGIDFATCRCGQLIQGNITDGYRLRIDVVTEREAARAAKVAAGMPKVGDRLVSGDRSGRVVNISSAGRILVDLGNGMRRNDHWDVLTGDGFTIAEPIPAAPSGYTDADLRADVYSYIQASGFDAADWDVREIAEDIQAAYGLIEFDAVPVTFLTASLSRHDRTFQAGITAYGKVSLKPAEIVKLNRRARKAARRERQATARKHKSTSANRARKAGSR